MKNRKSSTFNTLCFKAFKYTPYHLVKTFTVNRGKNFSGYANIENTLNIYVYFEDAYSPWQRCLNKNTNGLLRGFYPKKFNFSYITQDELDDIFTRINDRPQNTYRYI